MSNKSKDADPKQPDSSFIQFDDAKQKGAASAASAPRRKVLLGVLTAACTILIVVSLGFVHPSTSGAWSIDWIIQTVTGESIVAKDAKESGSSAASGKAGSKDSKSSDDTNDGSRGSDKSDSKKDSESSDKESDKNSDSKKSGEKEREIKRLTTVSRLLRIRQRPVGLLPFLITVMPPRATRTSLRSLATLP